MRNLIVTENSMNRYNKTSETFSTVQGFILAVTADRKYIKNLESRIQIPESYEHHTITKVDAISALPKYYFRWFVWVLGSGC